MTKLDAASVFMYSGFYSFSLFHQRSLTQHNGVGWVFNFGIDSFEFIFAEKRNDTV